LPGSGVRWQGLPLRVVARHGVRVPSPLRSISSWMNWCAIASVRSIV